MTNLVKSMTDAIESLSEAVHQEIEKLVTADKKMEDMVDDTAADVSARYWLMQFLEPLSRKELKSILDGFLIQMLNEEQAKRLVKFLLVRFPQYYNEADLQDVAEGEHIADGPRE